MKGTTALAMLASLAGASAFIVAPRPVTRMSTSAKSAAGMRMSSTAQSTEAVSNVVNADDLVRHPPGDVKLDQAVLDR